MHNNTLAETKQDIKGINILVAINTLRDEAAQDYLIQTLLSGEEVTPATQAAYKSLVSSLADSIGQHFANEEKANEFQNQLKSFKFTLSDIQSLAKINMPDQHIMGLTLIGLTLLDMPNILENLDINEEHKQEIEAHTNGIRLSSISHMIKQFHILKLFVYKESSFDYRIPFKSFLQEMRSKESIQEVINVYDMLENDENLPKTERTIILSNLAILIEKSFNLTDEDIDQLVQGQDINEDFRNLLKFIMPDKLPGISTFLSSSDLKGFLNDVKFTKLTEELNENFQETIRFISAIQGLESQNNPGNNLLLDHAEPSALNEEIIMDLASQNNPGNNLLLGYAEPSGDIETKNQDSIKKIGMSILSKSLKIKAYASLPALVTGLATTAILLYFTSVGALYSSLYGLAALALFLPISLFQGSMYQDLSTSYKTKGYAFDIVTALLTTITVACPALIVYGNLLAIPSAIMITLGVIAPLAIGFLTINLMQRTAAITNFKFSAGVDTSEFSPETMANPGKVAELKESWNQRLADHKI